MTEKQPDFTLARAADWEALAPEAADMRPGTLLSGVYAALPTPVSEDLRPDASLLDPLLDALLSCGISGFCVGGVTGEYPRFSIEARVRSFRHVAQRVAGRVPLVFGIGAEDSGEVVRMANIAKDLGAVTVLLPPPSFFRYDPVDVCEMLEQIAQGVPLPVLLYHIPQFTRGIDASLTLGLVRSVGNIVGVKDSSGNRQTLEQFAETKRSSGFILMAGSDEWFRLALELSADGAISGLSCVFPELMLGIYHAFRNGDLDTATAFQGLVEELATAVNRLPAPWAIKVALEVQGFHMGPPSWPLSSRLAARMSAFREWFKGWAPLARERVRELRGSILHRPGRIQP